MEEDDNSEDSITVNCLWVLATACYSQISHAVLLREGTIDILIKVVERSHSVTYCDYSLSSLLQLSASEECRKAMIKSYCHTVLLQKASCGVPSIVRRSLQVLANLCVDEPSRKLISELSGALQTVIKLVDKISVPQVPDSDDTVQAPSDKFDMRSLLQGLKFFSNLIQSDVESKKFRESGGIAWLVRLIIRLQAMKLEPVVEQQIAHLAANVLIYGDNHSLWVEAGGLAPLKCMLDESKHMAIQKEAARALSNLFAYYGNKNISKKISVGFMISLLSFLLKMTFG